MEDIPEEDLRQYCKEDVEATFIVYKSQSNIDPHLTANHTLPLAAMELKGLLLDAPRTTTLIKSLVRDESAYDNNLWITTSERLEWDDGISLSYGDVKLNAPRTISYILTGEPCTGIKKTSTAKRAIVFQRGWAPYLGSTQIKDIWGTTKPTHLGYPMPADKLIKVGDRYHNKYVGTVLDYRSVQKLMGTYIGPFLEVGAIQGTIHPKMNMVRTITGRLSSSAPNGQNMPPEARNCFISEHGQFHEIDFKQLEIVSLAAISQDPTLIKDLKNGEDIHYNTGKRVFKWKTPADMTDADRKIVKIVNFGLIYGGGAASLAQQTGQEKKLIQRLTSAFFDRYPGVKKWQEDFYTEVTNKLVPAGIMMGEQVYESIVTLPISGRRFYFREKESPIWLRKKTGRKFSFKPTETKNYPVQGFAGGDIVMEALSLLYEDLSILETTDIRMTVHDSILVDSYMSASELEKYMRAVCDVIEIRYNLSFTLDFDIKSGSHWK